MTILSITIEQCCADNVTEHIISLITCYQDSSNGCEKNQSKASLMSRSSFNKGSCWIDTAVGVQEQDEADINISDFEGSMLVNPGNDCSDEDHVISLSLMNDFNSDSTSSETFVIANPVQDPDPMNIEQSC